MKIGVLRKTNNCRRYWTKYYDGSFARLVIEYIRATGMTEAEVDALLEEMKHSSV